MTSAFGRYDHAVTDGPAQPPAPHTDPALQDPVYRQPEAAQPAPPAPKVALNLDTLEREGGTPIPFDFLLAGERYLLSDPQEVDWQDLLTAMRSPVMFFRIVLPAEQHHKFFAARMPSWKMAHLMRRYQDHYGLPNGPEADGLPR